MVSEIFTKIYGKQSILIESDTLKPNKIHLIKFDANFDIC